MKAVYLRAGDAEWRYEIDDEEYDTIIDELMAEGVDGKEMLEDSIEVLREMADLDEDDVSTDDEVDQTISVAFIWHYFNNLPVDQGGIRGDVAILEDETGENVVVLAADHLVNGRHTLH